MPAELGFEEYIWTDAETIETLNRGLRLRGLHVSMISMYNCV